MYCLRVCIVAVTVMYGLRLSSTEVQCLPNCLPVSIIGVISITSPSFIALHVPVFKIANVLPEGVYCCFTRTTTMFTVIHFI